MFGQTILKVEGMHCAHCEKRVLEAAGAVAGVKGAKASAKNGTLSLRAKDAATIEAVKAAVTQAGYQVK